MQLSIKRIKRLAEDEKPKAIVRYLKHFIPPEKRNELEVKLDEYAHLLVKKMNDESITYLNRSGIEKKLEELVGEGKNVSKKD